MASCDASRLYGDGGFYEGDAMRDGLLHQRAVGRYVATIYPGYAYERPMPRRVFAENPETPGALEAFYRKQSAHFARGAPSMLFELENAILYDRALYVLDPPGRLLQVYETNRSIDKARKKDLDPALLQNVRRSRRTDADHVYFGSVGSVNYGHWLVDDLPRAKGAEAIGSGRPALAVMEEYVPEIDRIRVASLAGLGGAAGAMEPLFVDPKVPYLFDRLFYVTPCTQTPVLKSPEAIAYVRERWTGGVKCGPARLFVGREAVWRKLLNPETVTAFFEERGFTAVCIEAGTLSLARQAQLFSNATTIAGVAGASMVNALFAPSGARLFYLAPEGFKDPWYWDLAAACGQEYSVCFGTPWKPRYPNFSSFTVSDSQLRAVAESLRS